MGIPDVTREDVAVRYEGDLDAEFRSDYVDAQVGDAVSFVMTRWRTQIASRFASGLLDDNLYKRTISDAVLRVIRNPGGLASENEGGYGYSTRATVASGNLWFTDSDIDTLIGPQLTAFPGTIGVGIDGGWN